MKVFTLLVMLPIAAALSVRQDNSDAAKLCANSCVVQQRNCLNLKPFSYTRCQYKTCDGHKECSQCIFCTRHTAQGNAVLDVDTLQVSRSLSPKDYLTETDNKRGNKKAPQGSPQSPKLESLSNIIETRYHERSALHFTSNTDIEDGNNLALSARSAKGSLNLHPLSRQSSCFDACLNRCGPQNPDCKKGCSQNCNYNMDEDCNMCSTRLNDCLNRCGKPDSPLCQASCKLERCFQGPKQCRSGAKNCEPQECNQDCKPCSSTTSNCIEDCKKEGFEGCEDKCRKESCGKDPAQCQPGGVCAENICYEAL